MQEKQYSIFIFSTTKMYNFWQIISFWTSLSFLKGRDLEQTLSEAPSHLLIP